MAARIKKGDRVVVLTGRDRGREGEVLQVRPTQNRVVVEDINKVKRHTRPTQSDPEGGVREKEAPIHVSNVALIDPKDGKPTRVGFRILEDGRKVRYAKRSGDVLDG